MAKDSKFTEGSAYELVNKIQEVVLSISGAKKMNVPILVEDENGRVEHITYIWYDEAREVIRLTVGGVEFEDSED